MADNPHPHARSYPRQTPIGPATICIQDDSRRHASHTDACPVGSTWGTAERRAEGSRRSCQSRVADVAL
jgi:hypothetical protein